MRRLDLTKFRLHMFLSPPISGTFRKKFELRSHCISGHLGKIAGRCRVTLIVGHQTTGKGRTYWTGTLICLHKDPSRGTSAFEVTIVGHVNHSPR